MSEESTYKYAHLRANVPKRRKGYWAFIWTAIVVFLVSLADMVWLDEVLYWGVIAAYVILFIWAVILLFSRGWSDEEDPWALGEAVLHCPHCDNQFKFAAGHMDDPHGARITCPICSEASHLPPRGSNPTVEPLKGGPAYDSAYECGNCEEHFMVSTFGAKPKAVSFETCPHCQTSGTVHAVSAPQEVERRPVQDWNAA